MIACIVSPMNQRYAAEAVELSQKTVTETIITTDFDFLEYIKQQSGQLQMVRYLILDLDALSQEEEGFRQAITSFRMLYNEIQLIVIASGREPGDGILHEIFCAGIYDIVTSSGEALAADISYCITKGLTYKDSLRFQRMDKENPGAGGKKSSEETIIIKNRVQKVANKETIGFVGSQGRIGVTHNAIVCGQLLSRKGFTVALVECKREGGSDFNHIRRSFDIEEPPDSQECFRLGEVDYYPDWPLESLYQILSREYNFILIDFGIYRQEVVNEFIRCGISIVVAGTKPWEIFRINTIFNEQPEDLLKSFYYVFSFTDAAIKKDVIENMKPLDLVYFQDYLPNPFLRTEDSVWKEILKEYFPPETDKEKENNILKKLKGVVLHVKSKKEKRDGTI